ncbi:LPS export ABC transporter permease LptF [Bartonella sp. W8122]|uniref:LPS export ABC transporter permease LptF n=1 Tax=Bartonella TaxID=773 RepID=UPI00098EE8B6|nr:MULTISPECIES: LPS export ABC transporter permease LptF [Bartonella]AQT44591.1 lipopolysaccharide export system permease protein [Bartonella apihabitans]MBH9994690.1 LPS export ABC transporter permease LptF [Bartonella sp. P0291]MBH9996965.1 LPS export ABC transporter permease LptF [Bartonella sp. M0192]MBH9999125.1 LPS export ABC transporter permease LptF [Bartonella sp. M0191]MBI0001299.1 LPS export ABC transporter permease LptF [Bartonella sp. W8122]
MRIIELYILRRVFVLFMAVLLAAVGISWTVQVLSRINFLTTSGQTLFTILQFSSLFIPSVIPLVIPFALVIAIAQTLSTMNQDSELVVINASGAPRSTVWKPILLLAVLAAIFSFVITNFISPQARITMREMMATTHSDLINVFIQEGNFRELTDNLYMEIGERHDDGTIGRLFIADQRDPTTDLYYYAVNGSVISNNTGDFLVLNNGEVQRRDNKAGTMSIIKFGSYTFNLSDFTASDGTPTIFPKDRPLVYLFHPDANDSYYQRRPLQYTAELHRRFTDWLYPIVFALIALAVAGDARSQRQARISASFSAISLSLIVYAIGYFFGDRSDNDLAYIPLLYILPIGVCCFILFLFLTNRKMTLPDQFGYKIWNGLKHLKDRIFRHKQSDVNGGAS